MAAAHGASGTDPDVVLDVDDLTFTLDTDDARVKLVDNVSFSLRRGETIGVVGESGSGKTMLVRALMGIAPKRGTVTGRVTLDGVDLLALPRKERRRMLGASIGMVFQNPMTSLNPVVPIGRQITEGVRYHRKLSRTEARDRALSLLDQVGIPDPESRLKQYPFQMSGGMRQRVGIASALACDPEVLIADEATTALDVTVQKQILDLIAEIQVARNMAAIIISHDLGVVAGRTDQLVVMYSGQVVEAGATTEVFADNRHRYTSALLAAVPDLDADPHTRMTTIPGSPRQPGAARIGCAFAERCAHASDRCATDDPQPVTAHPSWHWYRCHHPHLPESEESVIHAESAVSVVCS